MQQTISPSDVCQILLDEYKKGNYDPNKLLKNQFKIKNCNKKIYDKAKWFFKIIMGNFFIFTTTLISLVETSVFKYIF